MKKAVITVGGSQFLVTEGSEMSIDIKPTEKKTLSISPSLVINDGKTVVGTPTIKDAKVELALSDPEKGQKVTAIRYKAKKRVHKVRGHRQITQKAVVKKITA